MDFKKHLDKKMTDPELIASYRVRSTKAAFLFSSLLFFINIFLLGSDKINDNPFLEKILPISYILFVSSLLFLSICSMKHFLSSKKMKYYKLLHMLILIIFSLPLLVLFLDREVISGIF